MVIVAQEGRRPLHVAVDGRLDIGRECDGLLIADERVSRLHLRLEMVDGRIVVSDLGSSNGTFIDGARLTGPTALEPTSTVTLGATAITLAQATAPNRPNLARRTWLDSGSRRPIAAGHRTPSIDGTARRTGIAILAQTIARQPEPVTQIDPGDQGGDPLPDRRRGNDDDTITIMFSDIESSTEQAVALGDQQWYEVLSRHNETIERCVAGGGGRIVKSQGDGYMATFNSARRAVLTAAAIQRELTTAEERRPGRIKVRIGCHTGEAIRDEHGDLFGRHVIIAARVADLAQGEQILVSSIAAEITVARGDLIYGDPRSVVLKGLGDTQVVHELDWQAIDLHPKRSTPILENWSTESVLKG